MLAFPNKHVQTRDLRRTYAKAAARSHDWMPFAFLRS